MWKYTKINRRREKKKETFFMVSCFLPNATLSKFYKTQRDRYHNVVYLVFIFRSYVNRCIISSTRVSKKNTPQKTQSKQKKNTKRIPTPNGLLVYFGGKKIIKIHSKY